MVCVARASRLGAHANAIARPEVIDAALAHRAGDIGACGVQPRELCRQNAPPCCAPWADVIDGRSTPAGQTVPMARRQGCGRYK